MPDKLEVAKADGTVGLTATEAGLLLEGPGGEIDLTPDGLHWLVTAGGPAMLALLGGPIGGRGIERTDNATKGAT